MAIHDLYYSTQPDSWVTLFWRLQVIAEMKVGAKIRAAGRAEDRRVQRSREVLEGNGVR